MTTSMALSEKDDLASLVQRAQHLEARAFEALVELHACRLHEFLWRINGRYNGTEDMVQDVFLRMVQRIQGYKPGASFDAWVFQIGVMDIGMG